MHPTLVVVIGTTKIKTSIYLCLMVFHAIQHFGVQSKTSTFFEQLGYWGHDKKKILNQTMVKLWHIVESIYLLQGFQGGGMLTITKNKFKFGSLASLDVIYPRITLK